LRLMSVTALVYAGLAVFRPVAYQFRILPRERQLAREIAGRFGRSSMDFFKYWHDKSFFFSPTRASFLAYRVANNFAIVLGDPLGPEEEIEGIIRDFRELCRENDWKLFFHQTLPDFLPTYRRLGFKKLKLGDDAIVDLTAFSLEGKSMKAVRSSNQKLEKAGIRVNAYEPPLSDEVLDQARQVSDEWRQIPGRRERSFTLGAFEPEYVRATPMLAALDANGRMLGFVNMIPSHRRGEATMDLMRRRNDAPNGIMDYLFVKMFLSEKAKGTERFNLGMAPMSGFQEREEASIEERAIHNFLQRLGFIFSYRGLKHYKAKWAHLWEPRYVIYQNVLDLPLLAMALGKVSEYPD
jgi:phosphatidylglycerol lysyltransferase